MTEPIFTLPTMVNVEQMRRVFGALWGRLPDVEGTPMLEILNVSFIADEDHIFGAVNDEYIARELEWYYSQSLRVADIPGGPPKIWQQVADDAGQINSNYGYLMFSAENGHQFDNVVAKLQEHPDTRQAIAIYTRPTMHEEYGLANGSDFICTNTVQYFIRTGQLHVKVDMRSNDAVFGYRNDLAWQRHIQLEMARILDVEPGFITWNVGSLHVYPRHYGLIERYVNTGVHNSEVSRG